MKKIKLTMLLCLAGIISCVSVNDKVNINKKDFAIIAGGSFSMGVKEEISHNVTLSSFALSKYETTNKQVCEVYQWAYDNKYLTATIQTAKVANQSEELLNLDDDDCQISFSSGIFKVDKGKENYPCIEISWYGAVAYCNFLSLKEGKPVVYNLANWSYNIDVLGYRLPTEAEWEFAALAGSSSRFPWGDNITHKNANYYSSNVFSYDKSLTRGYHSKYKIDDCYTAPVGSFKPNKNGLYDMTGNVWEWCNDIYGTFPNESVINPTEPKVPEFGGNVRTMRGGAWSYGVEMCSPRYRGRYYPMATRYSFGFRVAMRYK